MAIPFANERTVGERMRPPPIDVLAQLEPTWPDRLHEPIRSLVDIPQSKPDFGSVSKFVRLT
jgi:hypothetical protein